MSGFRVKFSCQQLGAKGYGIIAAQDISKGTLVWTLTDQNHLSFTEDELRQYLKAGDPKFVMNHVYCQNNKAILCKDYAEFVNHSSDPNLCESSVDGKVGCWAARDIERGDELTDDYSKYETPQWYLDLCAQYQVESSKDVAERYS